MSSQYQESTGWTGTAGPSQQTKPKTNIPEPNGPTGEEEKEPGAEVDMAGQGPRASRALERSCHRASSSGRRAGRTAVAAGVASPTPTIPPEHPDPSQATRQTFRALLRKGLTIGEASNLGAYLCGIPLNAGQWSLAQGNHLLFLR